MLDTFLSSARPEERIPFDPVEFPHRYRDARDVEAVALLAASLAYGRADLFRPKVQLILEKLGPRPARRLQKLDIEETAELLDGFVYRFNVATDLAVLLLGMGAVLREKGSLEALFLEGSSHGLHAGLSHFTRSLREAAPLSKLRKVMGQERGLGHLLPSPLGPGAAKRLNLFLRWMVRGPDTVDFGLWKRVPPSSLLIPLDTHIHRMATHLGLTRRKDLSWKTAEEITAVLRQVDPEDPVRYDFALCHYGMSGVCPATPRAESCERCELLRHCRVGPRVLARRRAAR